MPQESTYTAEELAAAINRDLGTSLRARTVYFYRSRNVLSPLAMIGSQPKFTERHRLELKAILALQGTFDRPSLDEIRAKLEGLTSDELVQVAGLASPTSGDVLRQAVSSSGPAAMTVMSAPPPEGQGVYFDRPSPWDTIPVTPGVSLLLRSNLPRPFVTGLVRRVTDYCRRNLKGDVDNAEDWSPGDKNRYRR